MSQKTKLTIGLFGFGCVGEGIYHVLESTPGLNASIKKICIKNPEKQRNAPADFFTTHAEELLNDPEINVIVELIDDADAALDIARTSIRNGKKLVSANKKMIASNLPELITSSDENNVSFLYEAAVCGSIPVIRNLEEYYDNDLLHSFSGIVNGSTNYILTQMHRDGVAYEVALKQAQELGFAESDPSLDVEGLDAVNKLVIILKHTYGINVLPKDILHLGITRISAFDSQLAREKGQCIKLIATAHKNSDDSIHALVLPAFVNPGNALFHVHNENNGVLLGSALSDEQFLSGKGAGRYPTASAVLSDIAALQYHYTYEYKKSASNTLFLTEEDEIKLYVSGNKSDEIPSGYFREISESYSSERDRYVIGAIRLKDVRKLLFHYPSLSAIRILPGKPPGL